MSRRRPASPTPRRAIPDDLGEEPPTRLRPARLRNPTPAEMEMLSRLFLHLKELQIQCDRNGLKEIAFCLSLAVLSTAETLGVPLDRVYGDTAPQ